MMPSKIGRKSLFFMAFLILSILLVPVANCDCHVIFAASANSTSSKSSSSKSNQGNESPRPEASASPTLLPPSKQMKLNVTNLSLTKKNAYTLRVYNVPKKYTVRFRSKNSQIVSLSSQKKNAKYIRIRADKVGRTTVVARIYNPSKVLVSKLKATVTVTPAAISVKFNDNKIYLQPKTSAKLDYTIKPGASLEVPLFESSDTDVVQVTAQGYLVAISPGKAYVTATLLNNGVQCKCQVIVSNKDSDS